MEQPISEKQLILPSLYLMSIAPNKSITTTELIKQLEAILMPSDEDLQKNPSRKDTKFSQKVRNLKSHDTFEKYGNLAEYDETKGAFTITTEGTSLLNENLDFLKSVLSNDFQWDDTKKVLDDFSQSVKEKRPIVYIDEAIFIREGYKKQVNTTVYERSKKLRDAAFRYYMDGNGHIYCHICNFDFKLFYGDIGEGFIELHHTKPVYMYEDEDITQKIMDAIRNLIPVCSNCHRMIHRKAKPIEVQTLIDYVNEHGNFRGKQ
jgi:predicted HNH restriction endonuclease